jgi:hypothetical protein
MTTPLPIDMFTVRNLCEMDRQKSSRARVTRPRRAGVAYAPGDYHRESQGLHRRTS